MSDGEVLDHPRELEAIEHRLAQAQRGHHKVLAARLQERRANRVKDRNHKLSLRLVRRIALSPLVATTTRALPTSLGSPFPVLLTISFDK